MKSQQSGFTLIELVMVIVIIGILAAVAMPKFQNLSTEAQNAVVSGTQGALASSAAILYAQNHGTAGNKAAIITNTAHTGVTITAAVAACSFVITPTGGSASTVALDVTLCAD